MSRRCGLAALALWAGCASTASHPSATTSVAPAGPPCASRPAPAIRHVMWIFMENHSYGSIIGDHQAPYLNSLASGCGLATNYHNISHPSLPNYLAATSGLTVRQSQAFPDCDPSPSCSTSAPSIFGQGETWRAYEESMPSPCDPSDSGDYAVRHNPPAYYPQLASCSSGDVAFTELSTDLSSGHLPAFAFVTPNVNDDMHDGTVRQGDTWLADHLPAILSSPTYRSGSLLVVITWDEGEGGSTEDCAGNTGDVGCHVATILVNPSIPAGTQSATLFNHWSLLRTTEDLLGLPLLAQAASASSMRAAFHL